MGCGRSKAARQQKEAQANPQDDMAFCEVDLAELQTLLWNVIVLSKEARRQGAREIRRVVEEVRESVGEQGYTVPRDNELACRLLSDSIERESGVLDLHFVQKLETEEQVLNLILCDEKRSVRDSTLEILLQWYVSTSDCDTMLGDLSDDTADPEDALGTFKSSYMSFPWKGSVEENPPVLLSNPPTPLVGPRSPLTTPQLIPKRSKWLVELKHNTHSIERLAFALRGAMRSALRRYSTSHHDEVSKKECSESQRVAGSEWSRDRAQAHARCRSISNAKPDSLLPPAECETNLTVVLDLDETLVYARRGPLWVRPGVKEFLEEIKRMGCEVVCWTASNRAYAGGILAKLDPAGEVVSQCIYSHPNWQRTKRGPSVKNLAVIGRDMDKTVIIDNLPDSVVGNESNAIVVDNYEGCELHNTTLATLTKVLQDILNSRKPVPSFLHDRAASSNHLKYCERSLAGNSGTIWCYMLNSEPSTFSLPI